MEEMKRGENMEENLRRETTCCFTGHRPEKLPWGEDETDERCRALKERMARELDGLYDRGYRHFLSGMARGGDTYFAEAVLALAERRGDVTLEAAIPCQEQADRWSRADRERRQAILDQCGIETLVQRRYDRHCMHRRDRYMVERSSAVLALYDGIPEGGTFYTLSYAMDQGLEIVRLEIPN